MWRNDGTGLALEMPRPTGADRIFILAWHDEVRYTAASFHLRIRTHDVRQDRHICYYCSASAVNLALKKCPKSRLSIGQGFRLEGCTTSVGVASYSYHTFYEYIKFGQTYFATFISNDGIVLNSRTSEDFRFQCFLMFPSRASMIVGIGILLVR